MESKTSFFNKTIFMKDITRFWAVWGLEAIGLLMAGILPVYTSCNNIVQNYSVDDSLEAMRSVFSSDVMITGNSIVMAAFALVAAVLVFSYINNTRDSYMIHSLPVKKEALFISHYAAGFVMVMVPYVLYSSILTIISMGFEVGIAHALVGVMLEGIIEFFLFYSMMCTVIMISGNSVIAAVIYGVLNILVVGVSVLYNLLSTLLVYGLASNEFFSARLMKFSPVIYFIKYFGLDCGDAYTMENAYKNLGRFAVYIIPAVLFIIVALYLYKKRAAEIVGDTVAFKWCRPVFRTVFTLTGAPSVAFLFLFIADMNGSVIQKASNNFPLVSILFILCSIACYFISDMILNKTFFIWKKTSYVGMGVLTIILFGFISLIHFEIPGMIIPKSEKVACVRVGDNHGNGMIYEDQETINKIVNMQSKLKKGDDSGNSEENDLYVNIEYIMKGTGERREFAYTWKESTDKDNIDMYKKIFSDGKTVLEGLFSTSYKDINIYSFSVDDHKLQQSVEITDKYEERALIYNALIEDIKNNCYDPDNWSFDERELVTNIDIDFSLYSKGNKIKNHNMAYIKAFEGQYVSIAVTDKFVNTVKALKHFGYIK